jgi:hypothetical protein
MENCRALAIDLDTLRMSQAGQATLAALIGLRRSRSEG